MRAFVFVIAMLVASCAREKQEPSYFLEESLAPYFNEFFDFVDQYDYRYLDGDLRVVRFAGRDESAYDGELRFPRATTIGICNDVEYQERVELGPLKVNTLHYERWFEIWILNLDEWPESYRAADGSIGEWQVRWVMFHELGHFIGMEHTDSSSIMNKWVPTAREDIQNSWPSFVRELFDPEKTGDATDGGIFDGAEAEI